MLNRPSYVYAIGNATAYSGISNGKTDSDASLNYDAETSDIVYNTAKDFYTAKKSEITAENGFSKYWVANDKALFFGDIFICGLNEKQQEKINLATYTYKNDVWTSATYNISDFFDFNPISVMINGVIVNTPVNGEFDLSSYQQGSELEISAIDNQGDITVQPVFLVSHEIDTADKFLAFISSWDSTTKNITKNYYAVLTADIDGSTASNAKHGLGQCSGQYISNRFYGVFDGKGHTVSNIVINNSCLFGSLQNSNGIASIKNVAFINLQATSAAVLLGDSYSGIVENVYIKSSLLNRTGNGGAISKVGNVEVSNCIFDIEYGGNWDGTETSYAINGDATALSSKINNVYALGNAQYVQMGSTDTPYASGMLAKAVAENAVEITAQNGFNECWRVTNVNSTTTIYFGNNIVDTYTA